MECRHHRGEEVMECSRPLVNCSHRGEEVM